jgi:hypothetical protein
MTLSTFLIKDAPPLVSKWPAEPYKGLNYYEPEDIPLFAGRSDDLSICARLIGSPATRLFVLHGSTGTGKSSFLRAALVPLLERSQNGFLFIRDGLGDTPIFIRCTDDPFSRLAEAIHFLSRQTRTIANEAEPEKPRVVDFSKVLEVDADLSAFIKGTTARKLVDLLALLASVLPETLVVVMDQVEELFTLQLGKQGDEQRDLFLSSCMNICERKWTSRLFLLCARSISDGSWRGCVARLSMRRGSPTICSPISMSRN